MSDFSCFEFKDDKLIFIDQTKLPIEEIYIQTDDYERIAEAIEKLEIRGAPAIGVVAAYGLVLSVREFSHNREEKFFNAFERMRATRPTAVNLFWALDKMRIAFEENKHLDNIYELLLHSAREIHLDDIERCEMIAKNGLMIFEKTCYVLTHCNTGQLATGGEGTALNIIKEGHENGFVKLVYVDETRPLFQGSRLTAFELEKANIPFKIITDSTAAFLMKNKMVDVVITGADRIAVNGDTANKIGTYNLAVLSNFHKIPFYIAAPTSTIDLNCESGKNIKIEERKKSEILRIKDIQISKENYDVYSPAFDITPNELITGIITENRLHKPPYNFNDKDC
ncbi:MAG: S-methyl-5-thioribose-1-phosphate isomerase [Ignavibacteriales bacterium]|nr:S-methyl-5-thioribose-1-phosphate isomerase [Ignavibacteriales bacterium]